MGSVEGCDDQESVCSSNDREGDAFPKAFERELVTPTNLQKTHHADSTESGGSLEKPPSTEPPAVPVDGSAINANIETDTKEMSSGAAAKENTEGKRLWGGKRS